MMGMLIVLFLVVAAVEILHAYRPARAAGRHGGPVTLAQWRRTARRQQTVHP